MRWSVERGASASASASASSSSVVRARRSDAPRSWATPRLGSCGWVIFPGHDSWAWKGCLSQKIAQIQRADIRSERGGATSDERDAARGVDAGFRPGRWGERGIAKERAADGVDCG